MLAMAHTARPIPSGSMLAGDERNQILRQIGAAYGCKLARMPAPQPVSLDTDALNAVCNHSDEYLVSLKADGERYILILSTLNCNANSSTSVNVAVMVSRERECYEVPIVAQAKFFAGTILDGELVREADGLRFLVFDAVQFAGEMLHKHSLEDRMALVYAHVDVYGLGIDTESLAAQGKIMAIENLEIAPKRWWPPSQLASMWSTRSDDVDGIIFAPRHGIVAGTDARMFKWKSQHTVDVIVDRDHNVLVGSAGEVVPWQGVRLKVEYNALLQAVAGQGTVLECELAHSTTDDTWTLLPIRERGDKSIPNAIRTIERTMHAFIDHIEVSVLATKLNMSRAWTVNI
jgi:hypothetical protein